MYTNMAMGQNMLSCSFLTNEDGIEIISVKIKKTYSNVCRR